MAIAFNKNGETKEIATYNSCISNINVSDPQHWGVTRTMDSGSLKLTVPANDTTSARSETITISYYANTSSCSKTVDITQAAGDAPATTCSSGETVGIAPNCVSSAASSTAVMVGTWSKYPSNCTNVWSFDSGRSVSGDNFINTSSLDFRPNGDIYANVSSTNETTSTRTCKIPTKLGSFLDFFTVVQCAGVEPPSPTCVAFLDSCCGKSVYVHPDYDVSMVGNVQQSAGADAVSADCTFHLSSGKPSWMNYRIDYPNQTIWYDSLLANNTGWPRYYDLTFTLDTDTSSNNYCTTADVTVKQKPTPESSASVVTYDATASVRNDGSTYKPISGLSWTLNDGTYITTPFSATLAPGQTYTFIVHFPVAYENAALMPTSVTYPVKVRFTDNTWAYATCNNRTLSEGSTYTITYQ